MRPRNIPVLLFAVLLAGCGGGTQKHEVTIKIEPSAEKAAIQEDVKVGGELMDKLSVEIDKATGDDEKRDASKRLVSVQDEFLRLVKAGDSKGGATFRRKQLEGKTVKDLASDHREHPITPPAAP